MQPQINKAAILFSFSSYLPYRFPARLASEIQIFIYNWTSYPS